MTVLGAGGCSWDVTESITSAMGAPQLSPCAPPASSSWCAWGEEWGRWPRHRSETIGSPPGVSQCGRYLSVPHFPWLTCTYPLKYLPPPASPVRIFCKAFCKAFCISLFIKKTIIINTFVFLYMRCKLVLCSGSTRMGSGCSAPLPCCPRGRLLLAGPASSEAAKRCTRSWEKDNLGGWIFFFPSANFG